MPVLVLRDPRKLWTRSLVGVTRWVDSPGSRLLSVKAAVRRVGEIDLSYLEHWVVHPEKGWQLPSGKEEPIVKAKGHRRGWDGGMKPWDGHGKRVYIFLECRSE
jgi:hypothetical protein